jgi:dTDP-4-dehydrorhamnose 3,5-epimerase
MPVKTIDSKIKGLTVTQMKRVHHPKGDILHVLNKSDPCFDVFGESYYSMTKYGDIKGWKQHIEAKVNLVVPYGKMRFAIYDGDESGNGVFEEYVLSPDSDETYIRLTMEPGIWFAHRGEHQGEKDSLLHVITNIEHYDAEIGRMSFDQVPYNWPELERL